MGTLSTHSVPLLLRTTQQLGEEEEQQQCGYRPASTVSGVFSLSTSIVGAGIMSLPATIRIVGVVPGFILVVFFSFFTSASVYFLLKHSKAANAATYGSAMENAFGRIGRIILHTVIVINAFGNLVVYLIIMADVLSGSTSGSVHHSGVLEEWAGGQFWWNRRSAAMAFTAVFILSPLVCVRRIDSLRVSSALSVALAIVFVVATAVICIWKIVKEEIGWPKMFPDFSDGIGSIYECFTVIPVLVTAYLCHHCVHPVLNELDMRCDPQTVVRTSLVLCTTIYVGTSLFGYLLFGDDTLSDVLSNFDVDLGVPYSNVISDIIRVGYVIHLIFVFPLLHFALRLNLDGLMFPGAAALHHDTQRFMLLTVCTMTFSLVAACFIPDIWDVFQITGSTSGILMCFVFPPSLVLRDFYDISTKGERCGAWFMLVVALASSIISLTANIVELL